MHCTPEQETDDRYDGRLLHFLLSEQGIFLEFEPRTNFMLFHIKAHWTEHIGQHQQCPHHVLSQKPQIVWPVWCSFGEWWSETKIKEPQAALATSGVPSKGK